VPRTTYTLAIDGLFSEAADGTLPFPPAPPPTDADVTRLPATLRTRACACFSGSACSPRRGG